MNDASEDNVTDTLKRGADAPVPRTAPKDRSPFGRREGDPGPGLCAAAKRLPNMPKPPARRLPVLNAAAESAPRTDRLSLVPGAGALSPLQAVDLNRLCHPRPRGQSPSDEARRVSEILGATRSALYAFRWLVFQWHEDKRDDMEFAFDDACDIAHQLSVACASLERIADACAPPKARPVGMTELSAGPSAEPVTSA